MRGRIGYAVGTASRGARGGGAVRSDLASVNNTCWAPTRRRSFRRSPRTTCGGPARSSTRRCSTTAGSKPISPSSVTCGIPLARHRHRLRHARSPLDSVLDDAPTRRLLRHDVDTRCLRSWVRSRARFSQLLTREDVSNAAFPFATARDLKIAGAPVLALRITYVGELGYELHVPVESRRPSTTSSSPAGRTDLGLPAIGRIPSPRTHRATGPDDLRSSQLGRFVKLNTDLRFREGRPRSSAPPHPCLDCLRDLRYPAPAARRSTGTASASAGSRAAVTDTPWAKRSAMVMSSAPWWTRIS